MFVVAGLDIDIGRILKIIVPNHLYAISFTERRYGSDLAVFEKDFKISFVSYSSRCDPGGN